MQEINPGRAGEIRSRTYFSMHDQNFCHGKTGFEELKYSIN